MKTGGRDVVDNGRAEKRFRLDEPRSALRMPVGEADRLTSYGDYLNALDIAACAVTAGGEILHANSALTRLLMASRRPDRDMTEMPAFPPEALEKVRAVAARACGGRSETEVRLFEDGIQKVLKVVANPFRAQDETLVALTFHDLTRQILVEQQAEQLMREVDHRVKNTLALVLSISNRTASSADTLDSFRTAFSGRMRALAATHNTLAERSWSSIRVTDILKAEIRPFPDRLADRLRFTGIDAGLLPRAAIAIGLILHELIANALKFGALSSAAGCVDLEFFSQPGHPFAELRWRESGGPKVRKPERAGFGHAVITRSLQYSPHGGADLDFRPEGVLCSIRIPVEDLA